MNIRAHSYACLILLGLWLAFVPQMSAGMEDWNQSTDNASMIVVAIAEKSDTAIGAGATPRGYGGLPNYRGSQRSTFTAQGVARDYSLIEIAAWTIEPLRLRCMVYRIGAGESRDALLQRLQQDRRVLIAQPLHDFYTMGIAHAETLTKSATEANPTTYNDPYLHLQTSFASLNAKAAQRWSTGSGTRIALIDTAVDAKHPDLEGRVIEQHDLVTQNSNGDSLPTAEQRHGTEVAGLIAAVANNHIGIVGISPSVQILSYRACWTQAAGARCNSFTLALALTAAIQSNARIINLSLGGPADPLLKHLLEHALEQGVIVVGAAPPDGRTDGFPIGVSGVIAVNASEEPIRSAHMLRAPGRNLLTLQAGGHYGYASGSSLATAQTSAVIALLLQQRPKLDAASAELLLQRSQGNDGQINACVAITNLMHQGDACSEQHVSASQPLKVTTR